MIICIRTVRRVRWKLSISSQIYSLFPMMPPLFTFSVSTEAALCPTAAGTTPGENIRIPTVNKVRKQVFCSNQNCGLLMPQWTLPLIAVDVRSHKLKCHPLSLNPGWNVRTPEKRWNTSDALICSLMPTGVCVGPQRDACPLTRCSEWRRDTDWILLCYLDTAGCTDNAVKTIE